MDTLTQQQSNTLRLRREVADSFRRPPQFSSVQLTRRLGWWRNSGSLRRHPTWTARCVTDLSPRAWTPEEVDLVKDSAERTRDAIERARRVDPDVPIEDVAGTVKDLIQKVR
jgi:hypothetical protein